MRRVMPHLSCKRDQLIREIIWTGALPHLIGLPHLPGVPHLHVNRPFDTCTVVTGARPASSCLTFDMPLNYSAVQQKLDHGIMLSATRCRNCDHYAAVLHTHIIPWHTAATQSGFRSRSKADAVSVLTEC